MNYQEKVRWLRRYQDSLRREQELLEEIERLRTEATRVTQALSGMPGSGDGQALPRAVERILQAQEQLQAQINTCQQVRREIAATVEQLPDLRERDILRRRYILGQRFEQIAVELRLEYRWTRRLHRRAIENLTLESPLENVI